MNGNGRNPEQDFGAMEDEMQTSDLDREMAAFEGQIREAFVRAPAATVAEAHLTAMLAEAEAVATTAPLPVSATPRPPRRNGWVVVRRLALVPLAVLVAGAGMAVAGVRPPEPISDLFERAGVNVPGSDDEGDDGGRGEAPADRGERGEGGAQSGETAIETGDGATNTTNDGPTPGAQRANENAAEGQRTAEQARSGETPPDTPGRSDDHPAPQGTGTPPEDPGHPGQGKPDSPPGQSRSSTPGQGGGLDKEKPVKEQPDKESSGA
jgi:hypothetical protein